MGKKDALVGAVSPGALRALGDICSKLAVGKISERELKLFAQRKNPFVKIPGKIETKIDSADLSRRAEECAKEEVASATIVRVDRSMTLVYPDWVAEPLYPELEAQGPAEYDLAVVQQYLHETQAAGGVIGGEKLHEHLKSEHLLGRCLGYADALAIQKPGVATFRRFFEGKALFFWKGTVRGRGGNLYAPYLLESGGGVYLHWRWLNRDWYQHDPAAAVALGSQPLGA